MNPEDTVAAWAASVQAAGGDLPERIGVDAALGYAVKAGRDEAMVRVVFEAGRVTTVDRDASAPTDCVLRCSSDDFSALLSGTLDEAVGFMRGRLKFTGDVASFMALMPTLQSSEWRSVRTAGDGAPSRS